MAVRTPQTIVRAGVVPSYTAAASSETMVNDGKTSLHVKNGSGSTITVSFAITSAVDGATGLAKVVSIPTLANRLCGPFPTNIYGTTLGITYSGVTTVTAVGLVV